MQTFLPYKSFTKSAKVLDKQRCWKQVVETAQILNILNAEINTPPGKEMKSKGWINHPAVKMWIGYKVALEEYFNAFLECSINKHGINTKYEYIELPDDLSDIEYPWWLGKKKFHRSHRARLIEKKPEFYRDLFPEDEGYNNGMYWWPDMLTQKFYKI